MCLRSRSGDTARDDSYGDPAVRHDGAGIDGCGGDPTLGQDDQLVGAWIQPGAPPAEGAIGDDVMGAETHEPQIGGSAGAIVLHIGGGAPESKVRMAPRGVVREDKEVRI